MKYLTFVDNINTFNLKNHQVLKLINKTLVMDRLKGGSYRTPPLGLLGLNW